MTMTELREYLALGAAAVLILAAIGVGVVVVAHMLGLR